MSDHTKSMSNSTIIESIAPLVWERQAPRPMPILEICNYTFVHLTRWNHPKNFGQYWRLNWNAQKGTRIIFQDKIYPMSPGEVFLIPSHIATSTELQKPVYHFAVNFKIGAQFENVRRQVYIFHPGFLKKALRHFSTLSDENSRMMVIQSIVSHYLSLIPPEQFYQSERDSLDPRIAHAVAIMENGLSAPLSVTELCRQVGMSRNNFYRLFLKETKKTPNFFRYELRMLRASWLLRYTNESIDEIAQETGYADRYHFSKAFRAFFQTPPIRYRERESAGNRQMPEDGRNGN